MSLWGDAADAIERQELNEGCHLCGYSGGGHSEDCPMDRRRM